MMKRKLNKTPLGWYFEHEEPIGYYIGNYPDDTISMRLSFKVDSASLAGKRISNIDVKPKTEGFTWGLNDIWSGWTHNAWWPDSTKTLKVTKKEDIQFRNDIE
jgi:hypothetical protein